MHDVGASSTESGPNTLYSTDPVDLGAQSDLIGALEPISIEALLAAQIGG